MALAPDTPRLPGRRTLALLPLAYSATLHLALLAVMFRITAAASPALAPVRFGPTGGQQRLHVVFLAPQPLSSGGGGGGNQQPAPIRRAQGVGSDAVTLRSRTAPPSAVPTTAAADQQPPIQSVVLDAKPLASGFFEQAGLPADGVVTGTSTGPGTGGGVGTGTGTGIGPGRGSGLGPGFGGGSGGGVYRAGGSVSAPRVITQVRPRYTPEALRNKIQGTVVLEVVVGSDGCASQIRVVRSLDRGGLDDEAVAAVRQWQFEPGHLASGEAVDVIVTVLLDFTLR